MSVMFNGSALSIPEGGNGRIQLIAQGILEHGFKVNLTFHDGSASEWVCCTLDCRTRFCIHDQYLAMEFGHLHCMQQSVRITVSHQLCTHATCRF